MAKYRTSRILPIILTVIIIIVAIAGLVALARLLFTSGNSTTPKQENIVRQNLLNTDDGRSVSMSVRGPIVANEDFRSYRITVSPSSRQFQAFTGYLDQVTAQQTLGNNTAAYSQFVNALNKANFANSTPFEGDKNDVQGICATGKVYEFRIYSGTQEQAMLWTSTCSGSPGSLRASVTQVSQLFMNQIPSGSTIEASLKL